MRPAYVALLFLLIGLILIGLSIRRGAADQAASDIAGRVRRKTGTIFLLVAAGLFVLDFLT